MAQPTNIEWCDAVWNFLRGCRRVSPGCENCYAERQAIRHAGPGGSYEGLVKSTPNGPRWTGKLSFHEDILLAPLKRKTPTKYFVNSMSDLFYEDVTDEMLDKAFAVMALCPQHIFQILTKRPERMKAYVTGAKWERLRNWMNRGPNGEKVDFGNLTTIGHRSVKGTKWEFFNVKNWPLPNVWLGVSVENQEYADKRIPLLLDTPAAVRWISAEPLLGAIDLTLVKGWKHPNPPPGPASGPQAVNALTGMVRNFSSLRHGAFSPHYSDSLSQRASKLDWVVVGGESGPRSRPCDIANIRSIVEQCKTAGVSVFVKQLGADPIDWRDDVPDAPPYEFKHSMNDRKGGDMEEWPVDLRVREFPNVESGQAATV
jgi:protein gp37